jgi:hypothetical protein
MKTLSALLSCTLILSSASALAKPCSSLAYEEMKDMKAEELKRQVCINWDNAEAANTAAWNLHQSGRTDNAAMTAIEAERDQCKNEAARIVRLLSKTESEAPTYANTCKAVKH